MHRYSWNYLPIIFCSLFHSKNSNQHSYLINTFISHPLFSFLLSFQSSFVCGIELNRELASKAQLLSTQTNELIQQLRFKKGWSECHIQISQGDFRDIEWSGTLSLEIPKILWKVWILYRWRQFFVTVWLFPCLWCKIFLEKWKS